MITDDLIRAVRRIARDTAWVARKSLANDALATVASDIVDCCDVALGLHDATGGITDPVTGTRPLDKSVARQRIVDFIISAFAGNTHALAFMHNVFGLRPPLDEDV